MLTEQANKDPNQTVCISWGQNRAYIYVPVSLSWSRQTLLSFSNHGRTCYTENKERDACK